MLASPLPSGAATGRPGGTTRRSRKSASIITPRSNPKTNWRTRFTSPRTLALGAGSLFLLFLSIVPIWNAATLLQDSNYVFWVGRGLPIWMIAACIGLIVLYMLSVVCLFVRSEDAKFAEQAIMMVVQIFITLFGFTLMTLSVPLSHQAESTYANLMHRCDYSEQTHRLFEYSTVLQNIRATPACANETSVEDCKGYEDVAPYTTILKGMEENFRCSGFCYTAPSAATMMARARMEPGAQGMAPSPMVSPGPGPSPGPSPGPAATMPGAAPALAPAPVPAPAAASAGLIGIKRNTRLRQQSLKADAFQTEERQQTATDGVFYVAPAHPPTLFSKFNFQASCDGMAARDMMTFAGDISRNTFYQGLYLISTAVIVAILRLPTLCFARDPVCELLENANN